MTAAELTNELITKYNYGEWPKTYEVDAETYGNICDEIFHWYTKADVIAPQWELIISLILGRNKGILFKGVELIIKRK